MRHRTNVIEELRGERQVSAEEQIARARRVVLKLPKPESTGESRQVLYVFLTRARHRLLVSVAPGDVPAHRQAMGLVP
jgi:hypothetical protein